MGLKSMGTIEVLETLLPTTVQDIGRYGYQRYGVPVSGAMDVFSLRAGNMLVGNEESAAGLEITGTGLKLQFLTGTLIAVTGADLAPTLDGQLLARWQAVRVREGSVLSFEEANDGLRSYLCVEGGIDAPVVLGSRSTYVKSSLGGLEGRCLNPGDVVASLPVATGSRTPNGSAPDQALVPSYGNEHEIRVVLGPQHKTFTTEGLFTFLNLAYTVTVQADRTGCRLDGPVVEHKEIPNIISDGSPLGAVQVPADGRPIILLADRGTTGGYPKIATVISADVDRVAQAAFGDIIFFKAVTVEEARAIRKEREAALRALVASAAPQRVSIVVEGEGFEVQDDSGDVIAHPDQGGVSASRATQRVRVKLDNESYEFEVEVHKPG